MLWIYVLYALYSWQACGSIDVALGAPSAYRRPPPWSRRGRESAERLLPEVRRFFRAGGGLPLAGGRLRVADALRHAAAQSYDGAAPAGSSAEWIDIGAVDVPASAGSAPLLDHLLDWQGEAYLGPRLVLPERQRDPLPKPCNRLHKWDKRRFVTRLLESGLAGILSETELLHDGGSPVVGEFFAVLKPAGKQGQRRQRLIFDRRPQNACEGRLRWKTLPHALLFRKLVLRRDSVLRGHGKDMASFYVALKHHSRWWARNAAGPVLKTKVVQRWRSHYLGSRPFSPSSRHR